MRLEEIGEFGLIERIRQLVGEASTQVSLGIGDDGAIWHISILYRHQFLEWAIGEHEAAHVLR